MEILKFGDNPSPNRSNNNQRKPAAMIVAGVLVAMMGMSTTLAGTITIGTNNRVEFGQGLVSTAACDSAITVTPATSFTNTGSDADTFTVTSITLSGVSGGATAASTNCMGKYLTIKAYAGTSGTALTFTADTGTSAALLKFQIPSTAGSGPNSGANLTGSWSVAGSATNNTFTTTSGWDGSDQGLITLAGFQLSNSVTRFTIESSDS